jgi:hypothetical protein
MSESSQCAVCFDTFNKSTRAKTSCPGCEISICRTCLQTYVLNDIRDAPPCVNTECTHGWDRDFLDSEFTRTFRLQTYKEHRETVLRDRERSRLPETQDDAAAYRQAKQIVETEAKQSAELLTRIADLERELYEVQNRSFQARGVVDSIGRTRMRDRANAANAANAAKAKAEAEPKRQFIRACPASDCKGFLSTAWKCGLCEKWTCHHCQELIGPTKDTEHTCDSDKVASARLIEQESRPCPKCGARICKIDGCNQMWCTVCNTGFDWRTGTLAKGPIHNPHFFQWMQRNGNPGAGAAGGAGADGAGNGGAGNGAAPVNILVNCDQELDRRVTDRLNPYRHLGHGYRLTRNTISDSEPHTSDIKYLSEAWRMMREYGDPMYGPQATLRETQEQFRRLRVRYLTGELNDIEWSTVLQRVEKDELHAEAVQQVRDLYANAARDLIRGVVQQNGADIPGITDQVKQLVFYVNESFANIAKRFGRKVHELEIRQRL